MGVGGGGGGGVETTATGGKLGRVPSHIHNIMPEH